MARARAVLESVDTPDKAAPARRATRTNGRGSTLKPSRKDRRQARAYAIRPSYERKYRQTIRRIDLWTVLKISICFYLTGLIVLLFSGVVLWWIASAVGVIGNFEDFVGEMMNSDDFRFLSWEVLRAATLVGLVLVCLMVVCTVIAAAFYNLFAELMGGVEITVVEEENVGR
ncbi:MAG: DUF3566 domain-containing protein [Actinomycetota bacterium]